MPRLIRLDAVGPIKIDPASFPRDEQGNLKPLFICACGLSRTFPTCDGSHKACRAAEQPGILYTYDPVTRQIIDQRPA
jgi:CDGSH-type Zn-finger protein